MVLRIPTLQNQETISFRGDGLRLNIPNLFRNRGTEFTEQVSKRNPDEEDEKRNSFLVVDEFEGAALDDLFWTVNLNLASVVVANGKIVLTQDGNG